MDDELRQYLIAMEERMVGALKAYVDDRTSTTNERIERVETTLLTEFHKWASPLESRHRTHRDMLHAFDLELDNLKERVRKLEERRPPTQ